MILITLCHTIGLELFKADARVGIFMKRMDVPFAEKLFRVTMVRKFFRRALHDIFKHPIESANASKTGLIGRKAYRTSLFK